MSEQLIDYRGVETCAAIHIRVGDLTGDVEESVAKPVVEEHTLTIVLNDRKVATLVCSKEDVDELAIGYLAAEGMVTGSADIQDICVDAKGEVVSVTTCVSEELRPCVGGMRVTGSGYGRGEQYLERVGWESTAEVGMAAEAVVRKVLPGSPTSEVHNGGDTVLLASQISSAADAFQNRSIAYKRTHGVHSAALCDQGELLVFKEDIGRHNAIDRVFGYCILHDIPVEGCMLLTSGRVCSEAIRKVAARGIPVIVSIAAPTRQAVEAAAKAGITLVGSAKDGQMDVFTCDWRVGRVAMPHPRDRAVSTYPYSS